MITKKIIDFCSIAYDGNKMSNSAHAAYWLASQHSEDCDSALRTQETAIIEAFLSMANKLGYSVEKIDQPEEQTAADFQGEPPALQSALIVRGANLQAAE